MYTGPNIVKDSIIFYYDTGNSKSYIGEPTTNLLYNSGAINLSTATDIYGKCTKTDLGGGKYKFVNNGTGSSTVRLYVNLSDITNGYSYECSIYYKDLTFGSIGFDWCDTTVVGVNSSTLSENRLYGLGTRSTYDSTFRFLDINFSSGASVTLYGDQIEYKTHATTFVNGVRSVTQGLLPLTTKTSLDLTNMSYDSNSQLTFNGTSNYFDINQNFGTLSQYTVEYVAYSTGGTKMPIAGRTNTNFYKYGDASWRYTHGGVGAEFYHSTSPTLSGYIHYVITYDGSNVKVWRNNNYAGAQASTGTVDFSDGFKIGWWTGGGSYAWGGTIPIVKIYNRAISVDEVSKNYNAIKTRFNI